MNYTFVILGIIVVILIYIIYTITMNQLTTLKSNANLNTQNAPISIVLAPYSRQYTYNLLFYLAGEPSSSPVTIFARPGFHSLSLTVDTSNTNKVYNLVYTPSNSESFVVEKNVAFNQWIYISISVNNNVCDFYINGKLVSSVTDNSFLTLPTSNQVILGNLNAYIQSFTYYPRDFSAIDVYNSYLGLNSGINSIYNLLTTYTVAVSLLKNGVKEASQTIL